MKEKKEEKQVIKSPAPVNDTREFVGLMGMLMRGVLDGSVSPEKAKAVVGIGNALLRGLELNMEWALRTTHDAAESMPYMLTPAPPLELDEPSKLD